MGDERKAVINEHQVSMTEWLASIGEEKEAAAFREEDNTKDDRLETLYEVIGLPYERPVEFPASALLQQTPEFMQFLAERGEELCALRLVPKRPELPKLRNRGLTIRNVYEEWFPKQNINPSEYRAFFRPHADDYPWAMIIVIKEDAIFGEMIPGQHVQLTHGHSKRQPSRFKFDFKRWQWQGESADAREAVEQALQYLLVRDRGQQQQLALKLRARFSHDYLTGYFEVILWPDGKVRFSDYNRLLGEYITTPLSLREASGQEVAGTTAYGGVVQGIVRILTPETMGSSVFEAGDILVADNTDIRFIGFMKKAAAIVTDRGGMLSHASIIARELEKPCIVGTKNATTLLKGGDRVEVDADKGIVRRLV